MIKFKNILNEAAPSPIEDVTAILEALKQPHYSEFIANAKSDRPMLYRGVKWEGSAYEVEPAQYPRTVGHNFANVFNEFIARSPLWKAFPSRFNCVIMTTGVDNATEYGNLYVVAPVNGAVFGVCERPDVWNSDTKVILRGLMARSMDMVSVTALDEPLNWNKLVEAINTHYSRANIPNLRSYDKGRQGDGYIGDAIEGFMKSSFKTMMQYLFATLSPQKDRFHVRSYSNNFIFSSEYDGELWTSNPCMLIREDLFYKEIQTAIVSLV